MCFAITMLALGGLGYAYAFAYGAMAVGAMPRGYA